MNKKGAELTLNTIIIAILVVLVLVSVVIFFTYGFGNVSKKIKDVFQKSTAGTDRNLAIIFCRQYCDQVKVLDEEYWKDSTYCKIEFDIDGDGDGIVDLHKVKCDKLFKYRDNLGLECATNNKLICQKIPADEYFCLGSWCW